MKRKDYDTLRGCIEFPICFKWYEKEKSIEQSPCLTGFHRLIFLFILLVALIPLALAISAIMLIIDRPDFKDCAFGALIFIIAGCGFGIKIFEFFKNRFVDRIKRKELLKFMHSKNLRFVLDEDQDRYRRRKDTKRMVRIQQEKIACVERGNKLLIAMS